MKNILFIVEKK